MKYRNEVIADISRDFLNTNGAKSNIDIEIEKTAKLNLERKINGSDFKEKFINNLKDLNVCSQRGLMETFDSSIGSTTVLMPYGVITRIPPPDASATLLESAVTASPLYCFTQIYFAFFGGR